MTKVGDLCRRDVRPSSCRSQIKGAGASLPFPLPVDTTSYFDQSSTVTVQLVKDGGPGGDLCWTSEFDAADTKLNTPAKFKATAK